MLALNEKKAENEFCKKAILRSLRLNKKKPEKQDEMPINDKYDSNYMKLIPDNLFHLESENELTKAMAIVELTKILRCSSPEFKNYFPVESINLVLENLTVKMPNLSFLVIDFLGFLTYFYGEYSNEILSDTFLEKHVEILLYIISNYNSQEDEKNVFNQYFSSWCTLLANLFNDVPSAELINESNLFDQIQKSPKEFICSEYLRLIAVLYSVPEIDVKISSQLIKIIIDCIFEDTLMYIKNIAFKHLINMLKTETKTKLVYNLSPILNEFINILVECKDRNIIMSDLKLIKKLFSTDSILRANIFDLLISNDFCSALRIILDYDNPDIKLRVLKTINAFIKQDELFNEEDASKFISYDFKSELLEASFNCKIQIINLESLIIGFYDFDLLAKCFDDEVFESFFEILDTEDRYAKTICYQFFINLMNMVSTQNEVFLHFKDLLSKNNFITIIENDVFDDDEEKEDLKILAQKFLDFLKAENNE